MKKTSKTNRLISLITALVTVFTFVVFVLPNGTVKASAAGNAPMVTLKAHVQNIGWMTNVSDGQMAGTEGQSLRLEGLKFYVTGYSNARYDSICHSGIRYRAHVEDIGWIPDEEYDGYNWNGTNVNSWSNVICGTEGLGKAMEAIQIELYGPIADEYDIRYRVHVQNIGWMDWKYNGEVAGTTGQRLRMEAIKVEIVPKGYRADRSYYQTLTYRLLAGKR